MMLDQIKHVRDLVDGTVRIVRRGCGPATPLRAVYRTKIAVLVGPLIPDVHVMLLQPAHVGGTLEEPQQLIGQPLEEHGLRGQ